MEQTQEREILFERAARGDAAAVEALGVLARQRDTRAQELLLTRAQQADQLAFEGLWESYRSAIQGFLRSRLVNDADVQDILQEVSVAVWQKLPTYDPERGSFYSFVRYWAGLMW